VYVLFAKSLAKLSSTIQSCQVQLMVVQNEVQVIHSKGALKWVVLSSNYPRGHPLVPVMLLSSQVLIIQWRVWVFLSPTGSSLCYTSFLTKKRYDYPAWPPTWVTYFYLQRVLGLFPKSEPPFQDLFCHIWCC
jgi:hypothetical protein